MLFHITFTPYRTHLHTALLIGLLSLGAHAVVTAGEPSGASTLHPASCRSAPAGSHEAPSRTVPCDRPAACDSQSAATCDWLHCDALFSSEPLLSDQLQAVSFEGFGEKGGEFTIDFGGELRYRFMDEDNRLRPFGPARDVYDLWRWRNHVDVTHSSGHGIHVESIDASIFNEDLPALPIDENRWDFLQAYVDLKLFEHGGAPVMFRAGRQFLNYGNQRLISPLGWSNTFRTWDGFKLFTHGDAWSVEAFLTRPTNGATGNINRPESPDRPDESRTFSGVYATWHELPQGALDVYWIYYREQEPKRLFQDGARQTVGLRYFGEIPMTSCGSVDRVWGYDFEAALQFGHDNDRSGVEQDVFAGFLTGVVTHTWKSARWQPQLKGLFFWSSGDDDPNDGEINTFFTMFPLGHAYWGLIDNFSGQNFIDYSLEAAVKPYEKIRLAAAAHWFQLQTANDYIYNIAGLGLGTTGTGQDLGPELDLVATFQVRPDFQVQLGYFWHWYGDAINDGPLRRGDASQFYAMCTLGY